MKYVSVLAILLVVALALPLAAQEEKPADNMDIVRAAIRAEKKVLVAENMQLTYGVDTAAPVDRAVDAYVTADAVPSWANVLSVRVSLSMVSRSDERITTATSGDRLLRKDFATTISVRNRL